MPLVFSNGYPATEELVCSAISKEGIYNSSTTFTSHTILHGTTTEFLQRVFEWLWKEHAHFLYSALMVNNSKPQPCLKVAKIFLWHVYINSKYKFKQSPEKHTAVAVIG
jgi:hypothetical protein